MYIVKDGKKVYYLNLQKQVAKNKKDIEELKEGAGAAVIIEMSASYSDVKEAYSKYSEGSMVYLKRKVVVDSQPVDSYRPALFMFDATEYIILIVYNDVMNAIETIRFYEDGESSINLLNIADRDVLTEVRNETTNVYHFAIPVSDLIDHGQCDISEQIDNFPENTANYIVDINPETDLTILQTDFTNVSDNAKNIASCGEKLLFAENNGKIYLMYDGQGSDLSYLIGKAFYFVCTVQKKDYNR